MPHAGNLHSMFAYEPRMDKPQEPIRTPGIANVRVHESISPQDAPDPIRQSDANGEGKPAEHSASRQQIAIMSGVADGHDWGEQAFGNWNRPTFLGYHHQVKKMQHLPAGVQEPVGVRPNIQLPPAVAYGSLFSLDQSTYGFLED